MKSVPLSEREKERVEVSGTVDVFGPYSDGGDGKESVGDEKRHLSLQFSQIKLSWEGHNVYWKNEWTRCLNLCYA